MAGEGAVDVGFGDEAALNGFAEQLEGGAAGEVAAFGEGKGGGFNGVGRYAVRLVDVAQCPTIGYNVTIESPAFAEDVEEEELAGAAGFVEGAVVGAHDRLNAGVADEVFEGREVGVPEVVRGDAGVEGVAFVFGTGVDGVVLGAGGEFEVGVGGVALESANEGGGERGGEVRVFAPGLLTASPAGVAEEVDVGGPEGEALVLLGITLAGEGGVVFGAGFVGDGGGDAVNEVGVPGGGKADDLGEDGGASVASNAVEAFVPIVVGGDAKARDGGGTVLHLRDFFGEGEAGNEVVDAFVEREVGVAEGGRHRRGVGGSIGGCGGGCGDHDWRKWLVREAAFTVRHDGFRVRCG